MFGPTIEQYEIGPLSFQVKRPKRGEYTLWLGGCRIGKPTPNGEMWEFTAKTLKEVRTELRDAANRELQRRIAAYKRQVRELETVLHGHVMADLEKKL